jgi:hypothetical protein
MSIDIVNFINISVTNTPAGLPDANVNSLGLFTTESPSNVDEFRIYITASEVANDYGTNSVTAQMANNIFAQSPNLLSGEGRLVIMPLVNSIGAIQGINETSDLTANLAAIQAVADGDIRVVLNGNNIDLTDLDFTNASSFDDIAAILQRRLTDVVVTGRVDGFSMDSKKVGLASTISFVQLPAGSGTDLSVVGLFNAAGQLAISGNNAQGETLVDAIVRTEEQVSYTGVITDLLMEDAVITLTASAIQSRDMMFVHQFTSTEDLEPTTGICSIIKDSTQTKTRCLYYSIPSTANLVKSSYVGRGFSVNFTGSNTTMTMNLKALANVVPDSSITQTIFIKAKTAGADLYGDVQSLPIVVSNGANQFFDSVYNAIWFKLALGVAGFNYLKQTSTKIPQTEIGMDGLKGAYAKVCDIAITNEMFAAGNQWNGTTFGNQADMLRNITDKGYYIYSQPIAQQSQADRDARKAPLIQIAGKESGAIHSSSVNAIIER